MTTSTALAKSQFPTVFVVDDDADARWGIICFARSVQLHAEGFGSAADFLNVLPAEPLGCLILDVRLPGMSGIELQRELTLRSIYLPIVFLSGYGEVPLASQVLRAGALDFLQKPVSFPVLLDRTREAIAASVERREKR